MAARAASMVVAGAGAVVEGGGDVVRLAARVRSRRGGGSASAESSSLSETVRSSSSSDETSPLLRPPRPSRAPRPRPRPRLRPPRPPRATTAAHRPPPRPAPRLPQTKPPRPWPRPPQRLLLGKAPSAADVVASSRLCNSASSAASGELALAAGWPSASCSRRRISRAHHYRPSSELAAAEEDQKAISARSAADLAKELSATVLATASRCRVASVQENALVALFPTGRS